MMNYSIYPASDKVISNKNYTWVNKMKTFFIKRNATEGAIKKKLKTEKLDSYIEILIPIVNNNPLLQFDINSN